MNDPFAGAIKTPVDTCPACKTGKLIFFYNKYAKLLRKCSTCKKLFEERNNRLNKRLVLPNIRTN